MLVPIERTKSLKEKTYDILKEMILTGRLEPGRLHNEVKLAKELGVSRTPVREALSELRQEGIVDFVPNKGILIREITVKQVQEIFEIRQIIESYVTQAVASRLSAADLKKLDAIIKKQEKLALRNDNQAFIETDRKFHLLLAARLDNRRLGAILENLRDQIHFMGIYAIKKSGRMGQTLTEHIKILAALREGKAKKAQKAMLQHLKNTEKTILELLRVEKPGAA
jgi:DNA-binding GntR family transcriptional regulator